MNQKGFVWEATLIIDIRDQRTYFSLLCSFNTLQISIMYVFLSMRKNKKRKKVNYIRASHVLLWDSHLMIKSSNLFPLYFSTLSKVTQFFQRVGSTYVTYTFVWNEPNVVIFYMHFLFLRKKNSDLTGSWRLSFLLW